MMVPPSLAELVLPGLMLPCKGLYQVAGPDPLLGVHRAQLLPGVSRASG